jgi:hypothetical protein
MSDNNFPVHFETLDLKQAAAFLRLGYESMKDLVDAGAVPAVCLNQKHTVLLREDLIAYVRDEGRKQAEERKRKARAPSTRSVRATAPPKRVARSLPDLGRYESVTTSARPESTLVN